MDNYMDQKKESSTDKDYVKKNINISKLGIKTDKIVEEKDILNFSSLVYASVVWYSL